MRYEELTIEGRNAVLEAFRSGKTIDKVFVLEGCQDGPIKTILREAKKHGTVVKFVSKDRLDNMSETKKHQGVIAYAAAYNYATVEDILAKAEEAGERGLPVQGWQSEGASVSVCGQHQHVLRGLDQGCQRPDCHSGGSAGEDR